MEDRQPLVAGNWKLNGSRSGVTELAEAVCKGASQARADVLICPAFVHLHDVLQVVGNTSVRLGAQDCCEHDTGAFTGETAPAMLTEFGCEYVIVGHSERRQLFGDTDERVAVKYSAVLANAMTPILCVGETLDEREADAVEPVIRRQLLSVLQSDAVRSRQHAGESIDPVIAYEPVWAIGTGRTATPEQAQAVHALIRRVVAEESPNLAARVRVLYGGSVKPDNAAALFAQPDIDGGLVGGASLIAEDFLAICNAA